MSVWTVNRDVTKDECPWLDTTVSVGTKVYPYTGFTYGCVGAGVAVTLEQGQTPFFEIPRDAITKDMVNEISQA